MNDPTERTFNPPEDALREPDPPVTLGAESAQTILQTLRHVEEFFRCHASATVRAELRAFCAAQGWDPICGTAALLDGIGLHALALRWAIDAATTDRSGGLAGADHDKETTGARLGEIGAARHHQACVG